MRGLRRLHHTQEWHHTPVAFGIQGFLKWFCCTHLGMRASQGPTSLHYRKGNKLPKIMRGERSEEAKESLFHSEAGKREEISVLGTDLGTRRQDQLYRPSLLEYLTQLNSRAAPYPGRPEPARQESLGQFQRNSYSHRVLLKYKTAFPKQHGNIKRLSQTHRTAKAGKEEGSQHMNTHRAATVCASINSTSRLKIKLLKPLLRLQSLDPGVCLGIACNPHV